MGKEILVGRAVQRRFLREYLEKVIEEPKDSKPLLSFRKQRDSDSLSPRLLVFYGDTGSGKSSMITRSIEVAQQVANEYKRSIKTISIDWDEWRNEHGILPSTPEQVVRALHGLLIKPENGIASHFAKFNELDSKIRKIKALKEQLFHEEYPTEIRRKARQENVDLDPQAQSNANDTDEFQTWVQKKIPKKDLELCDQKVDALTEVITNGLISISSEQPAVISIDSFELLSNPEINNWIRLQFFSRLFDQKNKLLVILSANKTQVRQLRNHFPEEFLYVVPMAEIPLTFHDISRFATKAQISLTEDEVQKLEERTSGIPILIQDVFTYLRNGMNFDEVMASLPQVVTDSQEAAVTIVSRFLEQCDDWALKSRIFHLAMNYIHNGKLLAELWNVQFSEVVNVLNDIGSKMPFVSRKRLHPVVRQILRDYLRAEALKGASSPMADFFAQFVNVSSAMFSEMIAQLETAVTSSEKKYSDERYENATLSLCNSLLWGNPEQAFAYLPGWYLESVYFNKELGTKLIGLINEFADALTEDQRVMLTALQKALSIDFDLLNPVSQETTLIETEALAQLTSWEPNLTSIQKALLHRLLGQSAYKQGEYERALAEYDASYSFFGSTPEAILLFTDYKAIGTWYSTNGEYEKAIHAFERATSLKPDNYQAWFDYGLAFQAVNNHEESCRAFSQAVNISPDSQEALFLLGQEQMVINAYEEAVNSLGRAIESGPEQPNIWFTMGTCLIELTRYVDAVKAFAKVVETKPENADAWFNMGKCHTLLSQPDEAIESYKRTVALDAEYKDAWKALGLELYMKGQFAEAIETYSTSSKLEPQNHEIWQGLALSYYGATEYDKVISSCAQATKLSPTYHEAFTTMGHAYTAMNDFAKAHENYLKAAKISPDNYEYWNNVGNSLYTMNKYAEALEAYTKASKVDDTIDTTWFNIGLTCQMMNNYRDAVDAFEKAVSIDPNNAESWFQKGRVHFSLEQFESSVLCYEKSTSISPQSHEAWFRHGISLAKLDRHKEAIESFTKASELWANDADIWYETGLSHVALEDHEQAVNCFTKATEIVENRPEIWKYLGIENQKLGRYEDAIEAYTKAAEIFPGDFDTWYQKGLCHSYVNQQELALESFTKASMLKPENADSLYHMAVTNHALDRYPEAVELYRKVTQKTPNNEDAWYNMALAVHATGDFAKAVEVYKTTVQKWPRNGLAWYNLGLAYHTLEQYDLAVKAYKESTKILPNNVDVWYSLGVAFHARESHGDAIQAYRKVVLLAPDRYEAWFNLGLAYAVWDHYEDSVQSYLKAIELKPDYYLAWGNLAITYQTNGDYKNAINACQKALEIKSDELWIQSCLAFSLLMANELDEARTQYEKFISLGASSDDIYQALNLLRSTSEQQPDNQGISEIITMLENVPENIPEPA